MQENEPYIMNWPFTRWRLRMAGIWRSEVFDRGICGQ